ncbi:MAG TPA: YhgE/Pip domain-containing protein [Cerasibacillus sp.]|uniref:YhgE/Pip domain-containing protein n=1 Tax=Cerasibacillus sp. TaxID=2498711 RepID=UPI002F3E6399
MKRSLFISEWKNVFKSKKLLISITAVLFVPLMYAGMFLWAFWDPYDHTADLPIALINEDEGADFEGEHLEIGNELVDNLNELEELNFDIVSKEQGYRDLKEQKYYMLVEIPADFSKNATTLLDDDPKKLELKYIPNESFNFLSSQIGESAVKEIKSEIANEVSKTYAETMFDKLDDIADGFYKASDGSGELDDGAIKLKDGSKELKDNLVKLAEKSIEFEEGVFTATNGSKELVNGSNDLANGVGQLTDASGQLLNASKDVQDGSQALANGMNKAYSGVNQLDKNIPELISGTNKVQQGLTQFQQQLPKQMAGEIDNKIASSLTEMNKGLKQLEDGIVAGLEDEFAPKLSEEIAGGIEKELVPMQEALGQLPQTMSKGIAKEMTPELIKQQEDQVKQIFAVMQQVGVSPEHIGAVKQALDSNPVDSESIENELQQKIEAGIKQQMPSTGPVNIKDKIQPGITAGVDEVVKNINGGFDQYKAGVNEALGGATGQIEDTIAKAVNPVFNQLNGGLTAINDGQQLLSGGVNQLVKGTKELKDGSQQLANGQQQYVSGMEQFTGKMSEANTGSSKLASGANELSNGMNQLLDGSKQFNDASHKLADGSDKLSDGTTKLQDGTKELHDKLSEAADEVGSVKSNESTYDMMGNPVEMDKQEVNRVPNYGTGFAPYFISLGLFVGALLISIVLNLNDPVIKPKNALTLFLSKFGMLAVVGIIQALILDAILLYGLGLEVKNTALFVFVTIITSLVFMTLVQLLSTTLGDPGRFIAIVLLILQLTTSAGTFPLELIPKVLHPINSLLPMTYSVQAFKAVISSGDYSFMWQNVGILFIYIVVAMALTFTYFLVKERKQEYVKGEQVKAVYND